MESEEIIENDFGEDNSSVKVALRIRPTLPREQIEGCTTCTTVAEDHPQVWIGSNHAFTYDYVFDQNTAQERIFDLVVKRLLDGCLHGYNATILAYGQTGSGKTYTMGTGFEYDPSVEAQGIIPRAVAYLFSQIEKISSDANAEFTVEVNFVELYNDEVLDLLSQTSIRPHSAGSQSRPSSATTGIRIHEDSSGSIYIVGVQTVPVKSSHETLKVLRDGALSRTTASTNMNDTSSRSHAIFTIHVTQARVSNVQGEADLVKLSAKFHFVDLAGSERLKRTLATGERAKEGISINSGLLALGNVISALGDKSRKTSHVPYRDSKLTRLLQDSLGGNSRTIMIACVSPCDRDFVETLNTLKYANRARNIKNKIHINQDNSSRTIAALRREIETLQSELLEYKQGKKLASDTAEYNDTHQENMLLMSEIESLKSRLKAKQDAIDKLNAEVAGLRTVSEIKLMQDTDCDLTKMIQNYLAEIEDLRTKLYESEQECEKLRTKQRRLNTALSSPRKLFDSPSSAQDVISEAKLEIVNDKKKLEQLTNDKEKLEDGEESESDEESDEQEKMEEIAQLNSEISMKEKLIEQLEQSHRRVESMKIHYEEKLECLHNKIKATQEERDKVLASLKSGKRSAQVSEDYQKKISKLEEEAKKWQQAQKQHAQTVRNQSKYERQIASLKNEVENLKQTKVKLLKQSKAESARFRELELKRQKEIMTLKKDQRMKDIKLKSLENERNMKDQVLKRRIEEVNMLKRQNKQQMSRRAQGKVSRVVGSPVKAKTRWNSLQCEIRKCVSMKTTVSSLEREMLNLIEERTDARGKLEELNEIEEKDEIIEDEIENVKINMKFIEEKITDIQNQIAEISSGIKECDALEFDENEIRYLFKKVYDMNMNNLTDLDRCERRVDELEETKRQHMREIASLRDMLQHVISRRNEARGDGDDILPEILPFLEGNKQLPDQSYNQNRRKARRLTSTPQALLGSLENVSRTNSNDFLNPNDVITNFSRNSRQTQSLRMAANKRRPQLFRQDTFNVGEKKINPELPFKYRPESNQNGNNPSSHALDTTFLIDSPNTSPNRVISNSNYTNGYSDNNTHVEYGIRRLSTSSKEKVLQLTHYTDGHSKPVISMFATNTYLFTGSKDATANQYDLMTGALVKTYSGHPNNVQCVKFLEESDTLVTASGSLVKLWDIRSGNCVKTLASSGTALEKVSSNTDSSSRLIQPGEILIQSLAILRNYLMTTFDNRIRAWDLRKLQSSIGILAGKHSSQVMSLTTATNVKIGNEIKDVLVSGSKDHYIKLYLMTPDQEIDRVTPTKNLKPPHYDGIESLLIKNSHLYSGSRDTCIKKWDLSKAEMVCTAANAHSNWITGLTSLPDCSSLDHIISSSRDGSIKIWDQDLKEVVKIEVGSSNFPVESICVNKELVFTAGGISAGNGNNGLASANVAGIWTFKEDFMPDTLNNNNTP